MRLLALTLVTSVFILSCSTMEIGNRNTSGFDTTLAIGQNLELGLEPCGCSFNPLGGLQRSMQLIDETRKSNPNLKYITGGTSLWDPFGVKLPLKQQKLKVETLVESLNAMKLEALFLSADDLMQPETVLSTLSEKGRFVTVASNLKLKKSKLSFAPLWKTNSGKSEIVVFSLSALPKKQSSLVWEEPVQVLKRELAKLDASKPKFIAVYSNFGKIEREALAHQFPEIQLWVGEKNGPIVQGFVPENKSRLVLNMKEAGKQMAFIHFSLKPGAKELYSQEKSEQYIPMLTEWKKRLELTERELSDLTHHDEQARIETEKEYAKQRVAELSVVPERETTSTSPYHSYVLNVDKTIDARIPEANPVAALYAKYKESVHKLGLQVEQ